MPINLPLPGRQPCRTGSDRTTAGKAANRVACKTANQPATVRLGETGACEAEGGRAGYIGTPGIVAKPPMPSSGRKNLTGGVGRIPAARVIQPVQPSAAIKPASCLYPSPFCPFGASPARLPTPRVGERYVACDVVGRSP